ncbi:hypothetical protein DNTS_002491 [Danionella cerebrum]|uniref:Peptidase M12A domain-containing protein n=1 Tax=Danionella cerebrum TaxID=2873325 RepID=A0A553PXP0_9TELE|nr:hypothetical protein DNTS_002491 [Danionella translucida]
MFVTKMTFGLLALMLVFSARAEEMQLSRLSCQCRNFFIEPIEASVLPEPDEPKLLDDIAVNERNADPCTSYGCLWPKYSDGNIWVPYVIANHYSSRELEIIQRGLDSFSQSTCIRFFRRSNERDYISIESRSGCYSYVGRQGYAQTVSLARSGYMKYNFNKINTLNQGTPYDYNSVMQYERYAFSKNGYPTMVPIPNSNAELGKSTQMSQNDIIRLNRLYQCCKKCGNTRSAKKHTKGSRVPDMLLKRWIQTNKCVSSV